MELFGRSCLRKNKIIEGEAVIESSKLVDKYEKNSENPIRVADLSSKTMRQIHGIVALK
jgi:transcriptional regulator